jgi:hypothetical protein
MRFEMELDFTLVTIVSVIIRCENWESHRKNRSRIIDILFVSSRKQLIGKCIRMHWREKNIAIKRLHCSSHGAIGTYPSTMSYIAVVEAGNTSELFRPCSDRNQWRISAWAAPGSLRAIWLSDCSPVTSTAS